MHFLNFFKHYRKDRHYAILQTSSLILIWAVAFVVFEYFAPLYLETLNLSLFAIGVILSGSSFISLLIDPFLGYLQKRFPPKTLLIFSIILFFFNIILFINSGNVILLLFLATNIYGIAFDLFSITSYKTIFENSVEADRSTNISLFESFYALGLLIGAIIAGYIISLNLMYAIYLCLVILFFLLVVISIKWSKSVKYSKLSLAKGYRDIYYELRKIGWVGLFLILLMIFVHVFDGFFFVFASIFAQRFQGYFLDESIIGGLLLAIYTLPCILLAPYFGKLADKYGRKKFIFAGLLLTAVSVCMLQQFSGLITTAISIFLTSTSLFAITLPAVEGVYESLTEKKFGKDFTGYSVSIMELTLSIGFLFGPLIGGLLLDISGFDFAFQIISLTAIILFVISVLLLKNRIRIARNGKMIF